MLHWIPLCTAVALWASDTKKVDADLRAFDAHVAELNARFKRGRPTDKEWVKAKLAHMVEVDQYMRSYSNTPFDHKYDEAERKRFERAFYSRWQKVDSANTRELRRLLKIYPWFTISEFGRKADSDAWLLVQHADLEREFQKAVLSILEKLYPKGETDPSHYAYLYDRVVYSPGDPSQRKPQRYGTQGKCTGPGAWAPWTVEDPEHLDERRKALGMGTEAEYLKMVKDICRGAQ